MWLAILSQTEQLDICSIGAIYAAYGDTRTVNIAIKRLCETIGIRSKNIGNWNDVPERTHQEVIDAFEKAGI